MTYITPGAARAYLTRDLDQNLVLLGALDYESIAQVLGVRRDDSLAAVALVLDQTWNEQEAPAQVMLRADDEGALLRLLTQGLWPCPAVWSVQQRRLLPIVERFLGRAHAPERGVLYFHVALRPNRPHPLVRRLTFEDVETLALAPCGLSQVALLNWLRRGWRVFGAVRDGALLSHALAAYPIGDTEEVAAVFTASEARRQGLASAVVAAAAADIIDRGRRAVYATTRANRASRAVAAGLDMLPLLETWEVATS